MKRVEIDGSRELRKRAEDRLRGGPTKPPSSMGDAQRLLHELEVYRIELEIQNDELRAARHDLEEGLARYTELFDFAPIGYARITCEARICEINHAGARILRRDRSHLVGAHFNAFVAQPHLRAFASLLDDAADGAGPRSTELMLHEDGPFVRLTASALASHVPTILLAFEDITERRAREEKLARTEAALREADRRKDDFLAALSHELRNPLAPIKTSVFILGHVDPADEQARRARAIIERQVTHLTRLVDDLLDVTRITRGKITLRRERVDLAELVRRTLEDHRASFEASGVLLDATIEPGASWVVADPARVVQIMSNLLGNAEKFTPRGGNVKVELRRGPENAVLRIRDTGMGISPDVLRHLFEPFAQGPQKLDRAPGGLGLGLTMAKSLVELHGGTIDLASEGTGRGTTVTVSLPLETPSAAQEQRTDGARAQVRRRVLVIEDHPDSAESMKFALALDGHDVQVAHDGATALVLAERLLPEIVLCDIGLPDMDGFAVARAFRADAKIGRTYLVALSGYAQPLDVQRAVEAGFDRHIAKPPDFEKLRAILAEAPPLNA